MLAPLQSSRWKKRLRRIAVSIGAVLSSAISLTDGFAQSVTQDRPIQKFTVNETFDGTQFHYQMRLTAVKSGYRIYRLTYPSPVVTSVVQNNTIPADYYLPDPIKPGDPRRPAVICIHILEGDFTLVRILCSALASRGVPAIMFKLPYYGERSLPGGRKEVARNGRLFVEALPQCFDDARRTFDVLASRPEVDSARIGISGISLGGIIAASTAGADSRFRRAALILAGGDLLRIIHHARETDDLSQYIKSLSPKERAAMEAAIEAADPLSRAAGLRSRAAAGRVLMINATEDDVVPPPATEKLAVALGISDQVVWLEGLGHYSAVAVLPQIIRQTVDFFVADLPDGIATPAADRSRQDPLKVTAKVLSQTAEILTGEPKDGRCHLIDIRAVVTEKSGKTHRGALRLVRGTRNRFRLDVDIPAIGNKSMGHGKYSWMAADETVFRGTNGIEAGPSSDLLAFADSKYLARGRMIATAVSQIHLVPSILEPLVDVEGHESEGRLQAVLVSDKKNRQNHLRIDFQPNGETPNFLKFEIGGVHGKIVFRAWNLDSPSHSDLFKPPSDRTAVDVDAADMQRIFSSLFNFAAELTE